MRDLCFILFGVILSFILIPVLQEVGEVLVCCMEAIKSKLNIVISKSNIQVQKLQEELMETNTNVIGFTAPDEYEEYYDDEEDCQKNIIGFKV